MQDQPLKTILFVDNDLMLSHLTSQVIMGFGYDVVVAHSAAEAETILEGDEPFDLLMTDIKLGHGIDGFELAERARRVRPDIPVLYISGIVQYDPSVVVAVSAPILQKPVPPDELKNAISQALDRQ